MFVYTIQPVAYVVVGVIVICETYNAVSSATVLAQVVDSITVLAVQLNAWFTLASFGDFCHFKLCSIW